VSKSVRNTLGLLACLLVIGVAGGFLVSALHSTTQPPTHLGNTALKVISNDAGGTAKLATVAASRFGPAELPAGTEVVLASSALAGFAAPGPAPAVGATLSCDLRVGDSNGSQVIDVLRCTTAPAAAQPSQAADRG
jgi:hypothetical protein